MPIIQNRTLRRNKFEYLHIQQWPHDFLELTYPSLPTWLWEIPLERIHEEKHQGQTENEWQAQTGAAEYEFKRSNSSTDETCSRKISIE